MGDTADACVLEKSVDEVGAGDVDEVVSVLYRVVGCSVNSTTVLDTSVAEEASELDSVSDITTVLDVANRVSVILGMDENSTFE